ncbi:MULTISPECIES: hypothetical protein [unclassified Bradyrhizobium]|uniref:hypothetical protein n=1 Tax=unclassified Bradyrhizobium TaxID=2631580 RepID=UPI0024798D93|nr:MULTISPECIES: hypothetical protein [unclassified Bradyrhizobium]WGS18935.1 hypothetical protein MTX22_31150 [Bradyrhizobium sp. ISRA463]WGS25768.1 hypothetical protein MTX19_28720 [Bradyrhizobium sp. ISRA464]
MPKLYIKEFSKVLNGVGVEPAYNQPPIEIGSASNASDALQLDTVLVRIWTDVDCHFVVDCPTDDKDPIATIKDAPLTAGSEAAFAIWEGGLKIAVIAKDGRLS